ncbi:Ankyrin repeat-containing domain protein, partial [Metarhizium majus ARSEF 297]
MIVAANDPAILADEITSLASASSKRPDKGFEYPAASTGSLAMIQLFKDDSALGGKTANRTRGTLLHMAAEAGYLHVVEWLLDYTSLKKETATAVENMVIMLAAVRKHKSIVKLLLDSKYAVLTGNLLHVAVLNSWKDVPTLVASSDVSVLNWRDGTTGNTALHLAVVVKNPDMVEALLAVGADPNLENKEGRPPISMAVETENMDIVTALLDGAPTLDIDQLDMDGLTPFLRAGAFGSRCHPMSVRTFGTPCPCAAG